MSRVWQVRYRERATEMLSVLDVSPKDPQGRAIVRGGGAGAIWYADALQEDAGLRVTLFPADPHDVDPLVIVLEIPLPNEVL
jgi:hypothetical protein